MVSQLHTQYRKHYKGPRWDDFELSEYNRKRNYRIGRRSVEHQHQRWEWDSSESDDFETNGESNTAHVSERKRSEFFRDREEISKKNARDRRLDEEGASKSDKALAKQAFALDQDSNIDERVRKQKATAATQTTHRRKHKSKRKKTEKSETKARSLVDEWEKQHERIPFVSYGWANDAPIERKYTYNVQAHPKDVYPASLRALKRRELDIRKKLDENKKTFLEQEIIREKFFNDLSHMSPTFLTEYQSSYCNTDIRVFDKENKLKTMCKLLQENNSLFNF